MSYDPSLQEFISASNWFTLWYPRLWEMEVIENIPTFYEPFMGQGALQVFAAKIGTLKTENDVTAEYPFLEAPTLLDKMESFLSQQEVEYSPENFTHTQSKQTDVVAVEYEKEGRFYMACMYQKNSTFVLALYNCEGVPSDEEAENVGKVLRSVSLRE